MLKKSTLKYKKELTLREAATLIDDGNVAAALSLLHEAVRTGQLTATLVKHYHPKPFALVNWDRMQIDPMKEKHNVEAEQARLNEEYRVLESANPSGSDDDDESTISYTDLMAWCDSVDDVAAPASTANKWDEFALQRLLREKSEPGMTDEKLAKRYAVSRQRIGQLRETASAQFGTQKANPFDAVLRKGK